jgi:hypothetical protein
MIHKAETNYKRFKDTTGQNKIIESEPGKYLIKAESKVLRR